MSDIYIGTMGMMANMQKVKVHGNNIANSNTAAFKYDKQSLRAFDETFAKINYKNENKKIGAYNDMVYTDNIQTDFSQGSVKVTTSNLDFMISDFPNQESISFFKTKRNDEELLTRNGNFTLDEDRNLVTYNGAFVLDENGSNIQIPENTDYFITPEGEIKNSHTENVIGKLSLVSVSNEDLGLLEKKEGGFYQAMSIEKIQENFGPLNTVLSNFDKNITLQSVFGTRERIMDMIESGEVRIEREFEGEVKNNMLETANVDMTKEMLGLMEAQKGMQSSQKVTITMDKLLEKAANEIGR